MEDLLRKLEENQHMTDEAANKLEPIKAPPKKYVSVFYIDGKPILPPLMTSHKRKEMQKLKEEAIKVEHKLRERHNVQNNVKQIEDVETSISSLTDDNDNISQESQEFFENKRLQAEVSINMLQNIIKRQSGGGGILTSQHSNEKCSDCEINSVESVKHQQESKLKKLQKSETLVYDITMPSSNEVFVFKEDLTCEKTPRKISTENLDRKAIKKSLYLSLINNNNSQVNIPTICVKPPTPCVNQEDTKFLEGNIQNYISNNNVNGASYVESLEKIPKSPITERIKQFEAYSSRSSSSQSSAATTIYTATTPNSSPEKDCMRLNSPKATLQLPYAISRSATSPSLKRQKGAFKEQRHSPCNTLSPKTATEPSENELIRSNSFTLKVPSKALIDHMRQQSQSLDKSEEIKNPRTAHSITTRQSQSQSRLTQDTVESKAKKVYKVEPKNSRTKIQTKSSSTRLMSSANAASTVYNSALATFNTNSNINNYKTKRSPYESVVMRNPSGANPQTKHQVRKLSTNSSVTSLPSKQNYNRQSINLLPCQRQSKHNQSTSAEQSVHETTSISKIALSHLNYEKKDIFLQLLAQQEEEKQRLQKQFEMQQKLLYDQLNQKPNQMNPANMTQKFRQNQQQQQQQQHTTMTNENVMTRMEYSNQSTIQPQTPRTPPLSSHSSFISIADIQTLTITGASSLQNQNNSLSSNEPYPSMEQYNAMRKSLTNNDSLNNSMTSKRSLTTPRRRLFVQDMPVLSARGLRSASKQSNCSEKPFEIREAAATKINAYARGFLVRRLFQTEQIQRIVQTIRDTLIFVLNLHIETCQNPQEAKEPANIKLKARLLQQLYSATRSLHLLVFQTTIKERMNIIAQDRKRLKMKLLMLHKG